MLRKLWIQLRSSLWFVPGLLVLAAVGLALGCVELDIIYADALRGQRWEPLLNAGAEGARGVLTAIAGSMITVAGVAFSITIVTLSLASTQYTPRILRNFMRDRPNQFVLGTFVAIYTYCLLVMRTIRGGSEDDGGGFVPLLSVAVAMGMALLSIGCLIFFIHHVATSIQASTILKRICAETTAAIDVLFPENMEEGEEAVGLIPSRHRTALLPVAAHASGYIQHINADALFRFAREHDAMLRLEHAPGDFVVAGAPLAFADQNLDESARTSLRPLFVIGDFRTVEQDAGFGIRQIVDIAMKALSPGINDTSTAVSCPDYLGVILFKLGPRRIGSLFQSEDGELRVTGPTPTFAELVAKSFDEIRLSASGNVTILLHMLRVMRRVAGARLGTSRIQVLGHHARLIATLTDESVKDSYDRDRVKAELAAVQSVLAAELCRADLGGSIPRECLNRLLKKQVIA